MSKLAMDFYCRAYDNLGLRITFLLRLIIENLCHLRNLWIILAR